MFFFIYDRYQQFQKNFSEIAHEYNWRDYQNAYEYQLLDFIMGLMAMAEGFLRSLCEDLAKEHYNEKKKSKKLMKYVDYVKVLGIRFNGISVMHKTYQDIWGKEAELREIRNLIAHNFGRREKDDGIDAHLVRTISFSKCSSYFDLVKEFFKVIFCMIEQTLKQEEEALGLA